MAESKKRRTSSFLYSLKAVLWSFVGLRRKSDFETDAEKIKPLHIVIAALIGLACFIGLLITVVKFAVEK